MKAICILLHQQNAANITGHTEETQTVCRCNLLHLKTQWQTEDSCIGNTCALSISTQTSSSLTDEMDIPLFSGVSSSVRPHHGQIP